MSRERRSRAAGRRHRRSACSQSPGRGSTRAPAPAACCSSACSRACRRSPPSRRPARGRPRSRAPSLVALLVALALATAADRPGRLVAARRRAPGRPSALDRARRPGGRIGRRACPVSPADAPALVALLDARARGAGRRGAAWQIVVRRRPVAGSGDRRRRARLPLDRRAAGVRRRGRGPRARRADRRARAVRRQPGIRRAASAARWRRARARRRWRSPWPPGSEPVRRRRATRGGPGRTGTSAPRPPTSAAAASTCARATARSTGRPTPRVAFTVGDRPRPPAARGEPRRSSTASRSPSREAGASDALPVVGRDHRRPGRRARRTTRRDRRTSRWSARARRWCSPRAARSGSSAASPGRRTWWATRSAWRTPLQPGDRYTRAHPGPAAAAGRPGGGAHLRAAGGARGRHRACAPPTGGCRSNVPLWGGGEQQPDDALLGPYAEVRALTRRVIGDAATPYAAVNRIEAHLRRDYVYDEAPPYPTSLPDDWPAGRRAGSPPPLVDFLLDSRRGFCQHFAGSMAVMLRSLGIPARVAVGYTGGTLRLGTATATACSTATPTRGSRSGSPATAGCPSTRRPGRSAPNPASVSSPDYAPDADRHRPRRARRRGGRSPRSATSDEPRRDARAEPSRRPPAPAAGGGGRRWRRPRLALGARRARPAARLAPAPRGAAALPRAATAATSAAGSSPPPRELEASLAPLGWAPAGRGLRQRARRGDPRPHRGRPVGALPARRPRALRPRAARRGRGRCGVARAVGAAPRRSAAARPGACGSSRALGIRGARARYGGRDERNRADAYEAFCNGQWLLRGARVRQAAIALERAKALEPDKGVDPRGARAGLPGRALLRARRRGVRRRGRAVAHRRLRPLRAGALALAPRRSARRAPLPPGAACFGTDSRPWTAEDRSARRAQPGGGRNSVPSGTSKPIRTMLS